MDDSKFQVKSRTPFLTYAISLFLLLAILCEGYDMGASSGALLLVLESDSMNLTPLWQQLVMAGPLPTATLFTLVAARVSDTFGRKKGMMASSVFFMLGAVITVLSSRRSILLIGRLILGCGYGFSSATTAMYIAECSPRHIRGRLIGMSQPFLTIGTLLATVISGLFSHNKTHGWRYIWGFQGILGAIQFVGLLFLPESPRWLMQRSRRKEARKAIIRMRNGVNVEEEIAEIGESFQEVHHSKEKSGDVFIRMMKTPSVRRALMVGCGLQFFAQFSGVNTVIYYSGIIIQMAGFGDVSIAIWNSVIINCINLTFAFVGVWLVDAVGRRKLAIIGLFGLFVSSFCLATTFLMTELYSPMVNATVDSTNNTCSTYSICDSCIQDISCGFCFENENDVISGLCLPVNSSSRMPSRAGTCNSSSTNIGHSKIWAYDYCPASFSWVAVVGLALFLVFYAPSVGPLPWTINAEIYPLWARSSGNGFASMTCGFCNLISTATFLAFVKAVHIHGVFYVMAFIALVGSVFCYYFLPETKNKTLEEIESLFERTKNKRRKYIGYDRNAIKEELQEIKERNNSC